MWRFFITALLAVAMGAGASAGVTISINARDTDLSDVIGLIARQSGLNIVADASVKPRRITFRLHDVDADTALATLAQAYDLQTHRTGNIVLIGDAAAMNRRYGGSIGAVTVALLKRRSRHRRGKGTQRRRFARCEPGRRRPLEHGRRQRRRRRTNRREFALEQHRCARPPSNVRSPRHRRQARG